MNISFLENNRKTKNLHIIATFFLFYFGLMYLFAVIMLINELFELFPFLMVVIFCFTLGILMTINLKKSNRLNYSIKINYNEINVFVNGKTKKYHSDVLKDYEVVKVKKRATIKFIFTNNDILIVKTLKLNELIYVLNKILKKEKYSPALNPYWF